MEPLSKSTMLAHLAEFLERQPLPEQLWVFAYGSLLWNPEMTVVESLAARVEGYQRGFNLLSMVHRGTPTNPGLVLSLRQGGYCDGVLLKISQQTQTTDFRNLWLREMVSLFYQPRWIPVDTPNGQITAIAFIADPHHPQYVEYDAPTTAAIIQKARGGRGLNIQYFYKTYHQLQTLGIEDPMMDDIKQYLPAATT